MAIKNWISAFRLRTLPLALSSIALGSFAAYETGVFSWTVFGLAVLTTVLLQILSNLANDYGDSKKGTDNEARVGPERAVQSGAISLTEMKSAIVICASLAFLSGISLIFAALGTDNFGLILLFLFLGIGSIAAAVKYTVGQSAYGYQGMGDIAVFIFFGLVGVAGTYFLHTQHFDALLLLPAASIGMLSAGVLNLNNMRDRENDSAMGKNTLAVRLGVSKSKYYQLFLLLGANLFGLVYTILRFDSNWQLLFLITLPLILSNLKSVFSIEEPRRLDPLLKKLAISTLLFALTFGIGLIL